MPLTDEQADRKVEKIRRSFKVRFKAWRRELAVKIGGAKKDRADRIAAIRKRIAPPGARKLSLSGVKFIAGWEGFRSTPYNDAAGHATIGYGHLLHFGPVTQADIAKWGSISKDEALKLLADDAAIAEKAVLEDTRDSTLQHELDAMISLAFNIGTGGFQNSTVRREHNAGNRTKAADAFLMWVKAGGVTVQGLVNRRKAEKAKYLG